MLFRSSNNSINLDILVDKVANKISNAINNSNKDKIIQTSINIDGHKIATATSRPLNNIQNSQQFINQRNGGY